jgi:hypothetical protein
MVKIKEIKYALPNWTTPNKAPKTKKLKRVSGILICDDFILFRFLKTLRKNNQNNQQENHA